MPAPTDLGSAVASLLQVPGFQEIVNQAVTQQRQLAPVRTAATQQVLNTLPGGAFPSGGSMTAGGRPNVSAIAPANFQTPAPSGGGGMDLSTLLALLAGGGGALAKLLQNGGGNGSGGSMNLSPLASALKRLFGGGGLPSGGPANGEPGGNLSSWNPLGQTNDQGGSLFPNGNMTTLPPGQSPSYDFSGLGSLDSSANAGDSTSGGGMDGLLTGGSSWDGYGG